MIFLNKKSYKKKLLSPTTLLILITASFFTMLNANGFGKIFDRVHFKENGPTLSGYQKIYLAPVQVDIPNNKRKSIRATGPDDRYISSKDQEKKASDLYRVLSQALGKNYELVEEEGPSILTIETVITRLQSTRPTLSDLSNRNGLRFDSVYAGGAAMSMTFSENGATIVQISDSHSGNFNDGTVRIGVWSDADRIFNRWCRQLRRFIKTN